MARPRSTLPPIPHVERHSKDHKALLLSTEKDLYQMFAPRLYTDILSSQQPSQKFTQGKLNREFKASLTEFQVLQRRAIEKERTSAAAARAALEDSHDPSHQQSGGQQQQQQLQEQDQLRLAPQDEVDFQESLIIERESEIRNIEQSVGELNELFRDVAHMVHEQGEQLDIISENVEGVRTDTRGAHVELTSASRHQKAARNKACCLLMILAVVLTIVILAVVLG